MAAWHGDVLQAIHESDGPVFRSRRRKRATELCWTKRNGFATSNLDERLLNFRKGRGGRLFDRFHLMMGAIDCLPQTGGQGTYLKLQLREKFIEYKTLNSQIQLR